MTDSVEMVRAGVKAMMVIFGTISASALMAQGLVTAAMGTRATLKSYVDADGKIESATVNVKGIGFPLKVLEVSETGFVRVTLGDKDVWLDRKQIRIPPDSLEANCLTVNRINANLVSGGTRGANNGCK